MNIQDSLEILLRWLEDNVEMALLNKSDFG
ncbi:Uncharacterised protein [Klebsiella pneumoniae]|nr:Uncharacterised protein [Klebsiella pneumoniae]